MSRTSSTPDLVAFFEGTGTDDQGRSLSEILAWSDRELEWSHDYIQIVFPLPERSDFQHTVAVIDARVFDEFHTRKELRDSLRTAFKRILAFYGFELQENESGNPIVKKAPDFNSNPKVWNRRMDHNHLRITRIIRSLRILGLGAEAIAWYHTLSAFADHASESSRGYWKRAAFRSLNIPPDDTRSKDDNRIVGESFLIKYEEDRAKKTNDVEAKSYTEESSEEVVVPQWNQAMNGLSKDREIRDNERPDAMSECDKNRMDWKI